jgi:predicted RNA-binding protein with PUA-like domain
MPKVTNEPSYWLMKAEPETRIEKGVDVKFSIHDLEQVQRSEWGTVLVTKRRRAKLRS